MRIVLRLSVTIVVLAGVLAGTVAALAPYAAQVPEVQATVAEEIDLTQLDAYAVRSYVYAADGGLLATLHGVENREPVTIEEVPEPVVQSILAIEDADFYHHGGVNLRATARALLENVAEGGVVQGGSTITQQLVKNALLTADQDLDRKTKEAALALRLERELDKDQILELYLNTVYFGSGAYGVQAAAETYWGVDVEQLGWAEGALLAALIANPDRYDPTLRPDAALRQRRIALERLVSLELIDREQAEQVALEPLPQVRCAGATADRGACNTELVLPPPEDYFVEDVKQALLNDPRYNLGATPEERLAAVFSGGIRVYTTLDPAVQFAAEAAIVRGLPDNEAGISAALVALEPDTGAVRAMVGGPGFEVFRYNVATHRPGRQTGSAFKTFVLLAALEQGAVPTDYVDGGGRFPNPGGTPDPYPVSGSGGTLARVTASSSNGAFVRLGLMVGLDNVVEIAQRLGIDSDFSGLPISMPLGVVETTPLEMASAYGALANGGVHEPAYLIERIETREGAVLYEHIPQGTRAVSRQSACLATEALDGVVRSGTGTRARLGRQPAAGKTGTTEEHFDAWFVGYTPYLSTAVWMGNPDENISMRNLGGVANFGGTYPAQVWGEFNKAFHAGKEPKAFPTCDRTRSGRTLRGQGGLTLGGSSSSSGSSGSSGSSSSSGSRSGSSTTTTAPAAADDGAAATPDEPTPTTEPPPEPTPEPEPPPTTAKPDDPPPQPNQGG